MKILAQLLAVYLFLGSLMPGMDFTQLAKVGTMVVHYQTHKVEAKLAAASTSFVDYLNVHLFTPDGHEHNDFDHNQLPYQSLTNTMLVVQLHDSAGFRLRTVFIENDHNFFYNTLPSTNPCFNIFHPPMA